MLRDLVTHIGQKASEVRCCIYRNLRDTRQYLLGIRESVRETCEELLEIHDELRGTRGKMSEAREFRREMAETERERDERQRVLVERGRVEDENLCVPLKLIAESVSRLRSVNRTATIRAGNGIC